MNSFKEVLFGKVDLDALTVGLVMGITPCDQNLRSLKGSAKAEEIADPAVLCIECGGSGQTDKNNFDHHPSDGEKKIDLSAAAQALERLARLVRYVDEVDRGIRHDTGCQFPSLVQLIAGMKLIIKDPEEQMRKGLAVLRAVVQSGLDPYGCMEKITSWIPEAETWISEKREHEKRFKEVLDKAIWFTTITGIKVAAVSTTWIGAPGALYGYGAHAVIALNPEFEQGGVKYRKFTVAVHRDTGLNLFSAIENLNALEKGWGGPTHGTIIGSPQGKDSQRTIEEVAGVVVACLQSQKLVKAGIGKANSKGVTLNRKERRQVA
ncbi:MAG: hypothetical protein WCT39_05775 [Candidatus Margulisiibacteriota bacterium]